MTIKCINHTIIANNSLFNLSPQLTVYKSNDVLVYCKKKKKNWILKGEKQIRITTNKYNNSYIKSKFLNTLIGI